MKTKYLVLNCLLLIVLGAPAQQITRPLKKGDKVPDIQLAIAKGGNEKNKIIRTVHDLRGKLVIVNFWGTDCGSCIAGMQDLLELQRKFPDDLIVLLATKDKPAAIQKLLAKYEHKQQAARWVAAARELLFVADDSNLHRLFPHPGKPIDVWIDKNGTYINMAGASTTTSENVTKSLSGISLELDEINGTKLNREKPLSWFNGTGSPDVTNFSFMYPSSYQPSAEYFSNVVQDTGSGQSIGVNCYNNNIMDLYSLAYKNWMPLKPYSRNKGKIPLNRIVIEAAEKTKFTAPRDKREIPHWKKKFLYTYACRVPGTSMENLLKVMQTDIDRYLQLKSSIEKRTVWCYILKANAKFPSTMKQKKRKYMLDTTSNKLHLDSVSISMLLKMHLEPGLNQLSADKPFFDETGYTGLIWMQLDWLNTFDKNTFSSLSAQLSNYGLELSLEQRNIEMLVIKDNTTL